MLHLTHFVRIALGRGIGAFGLFFGAVGVALLAAGAAIEGRDPESIHD